MKKDITSLNFYSEVLEADKPVLIDFYAPWCGPCKMLAPVIDQLAKESDSYHIGKIDVDEEPALAERFQVSSVPTLLIFKGGECIKRLVGVQSKDVLRAALQ